MRHLLQPKASSASQRWRWGVGLYPPLLLAWLALNGTAGWEIGLAAAAAGAFAGAMLAPGEPYPWRPGQLLSFGAFFLRQSLRGGIDVARRALHPRLPIAPHWVDHRLSLPPGQPRTLMISLVSLLPGSLAVDLDAKNNVLRVHVLVPGGGRLLGEIETRIARLFALDEQP